MVSGPVRRILAESGHIAGIINPPAQKKRGYWVNENDPLDLDAWLAGATKYQGSWWVDWLPWLEKQSDELVAPPPVGNAEFPPIMDAPGANVLEK